MEQNTLDRDQDNHREDERKLPAEQKLHRMSQMQECQREKNISHINSPAELTASNDRERGRGREHYDIEIPADAEIAMGRLQQRKE